MPSEVKMPDSHYLNMARLHGESSNLLDANTLLHYTVSARTDRQQRDMLMNEAMDKVTQCLNHIVANKIQTHLPSEDICIQDCRKVITGMPSSELRTLIKKLNIDTLSCPQKIHAVLHYL